MNKSKRKGIVGIGLAAFMVCALLVSAGGFVAYGLPVGGKADIGEVLNYSEGGEETRVASGIPHDEPLAESGIALLVDEDGWVIHDAPAAKDIRELSIQSLAEFEALFPPNPDGEFIIHDIPHLPVVIDGVRYEPEDIRLFNGQVLRFVLDDEAIREGVIYAFTTPEGLERFVKERWGVELFEDRPEPVIAAAIYSVLHEHWRLGGTGLALPHPNYYPHLGVYDFDNITSSASTGPGPVTLYDGYLFTGNSVLLRAGTTYDFLWWFNDKASSVVTH